MSPQNERFASRGGSPLALGSGSHREWGWESVLACLPPRCASPRPSPRANESVFLYRIFNISSGKQKKLFKGSQGEDGTLIKVRAQSDGRWSREW